MFWKKKQVAAAGVLVDGTVAMPAGSADVNERVAEPRAKAKKLPGPKDMPFLVGKDVVVKLRKEPDWVWSLKAVMRQNPKGKRVYDFRVFSDVATRQKGVRVKDYTTLDAHPDLILFDGWYDESQYVTHITERTQTPVV